MKFLSTFLHFIIVLLFISFDNSISIIEEEPETPIEIPNLLLQLNEIK